MGVRSTLLLTPINLSTSNACRTKAASDSLPGRKESTRWQTDPHTVVYYNFEGHKPSTRVLQNSSPVRSPALHGAIVGCRWTEGRWPGKSALEFKGPEDRVRLNVPGDYRSIVLGADLMVFDDV